VARLQAEVFFVSLMVCVAVFVATAGLLVYTVWRFRARGGEEATPLVHTHGNLKIELALIGVVFLLLLIIAVPNMRALFAASTPPAGEEVLPVQVTGHQWWWAFAYPSLGVVTANELHIPVGRAVQLHLRAADVIHSFWIPRLAGKMDLIPNQDNQMWLKADKPGVYVGQCAEFCGVSHAHMGFRVVAQEAADFAAWVQTQQQPAPAPGTALAAQGAQLFIQKGCLACHAIAGTLAQGVVGPNLTHMGSRQTLAAGMLPNTPDHLARWLKDPQAVKPASLMPNLGLDDDTIAALVAYLQGLK
jgi:cytochrome c oxidase subunit 2